MSWPSGENAIALTSSVCPAKLRSNVPRSASQILTVLSELPVATTCPLGRDVEHAGHPMRMAELLTTLRTPSFIARTAVHTPLHAIRTKEVLRRAFSYQAAGTCFSMVEVLSTCPTNWGMPPADAVKWVEENMVPYYALGIFKTPDDESRAPVPKAE